MNLLRAFLSNSRLRNATIGIIVLLVLSVVPFFKAPPPHVELAAEALLEHGPKWFTNGLLTTLLVDLIIILMAVFAVSRMKEVPGAWQNIVEMLVEGMWNLTQSIAGHGSANSRKFFPWVITIFIFVLVSNYIGLLPGFGSIGIYHSGAESHAQAELGNRLAMAGAESVAAAPAEEGKPVLVPLFRSPSADLNMTLALALISVFMTQFFGVQALGLRYFTKFFKNPFKDGMGAVVAFFELIAEISKIISFSFRLFGNIFAGEVVLLVMAFLVTFLLPSIFYGLELFIGFIQALVFMLLTLAFFTMATVSHDDHH
ncbi:MAG: F0F1 ATP synthase subunit A [Caldilineaceae bacterium SB0661_bin_32]|uniref:ATP synthase subunit a n=1 Tax=Caldilineaceae bacterium SB0661_bin_32 TaxID=2605255 RepID=A0A6B1D670_9CHLR|nr:F0F1 ATP synthase subunit A [Caldilineaceae bacterium SB0661_bin_32]